MNGITIHIGSVFDVLPTLPDNSVQCCVTSPPYWGLRDYLTATWEGGQPDCDHQKPNADSGHIAHSTLGGGKATNAAQVGGYRGKCGKCGARRIDQQLGLEPTPEEYVANMVKVFREVRRVLRNDGVLFLNLGDSYAGSWKNYGGQNRGHGTQREIIRGSDRPPTASVPGLKPKDLVGIPWSVAFALRADGWWLRSDIPWVKRSAMPESVTDRPAKALEYVFLLAKSERYYFDMHAVKRVAAYAGTDRGGSTNRYEQNAAGMDSKQYATRNFRNADLWFESVNSPHGMVTLGDEIVGLDVNPASCKEAHFATFPPNLIRPCIMAGTSEEGCCETCGAPWERVVETTPMVLARSERTHEKGRTRTSGTMVEPPSSRTTGWQPTCTCEQNKPVPCTVLDPFFGSGTTGQVARECGCKCIGIELNPEYVTIAKERNKQASLLI